MSDKAQPTPEQVAEMERREKAALAAKMHLDPPLRPEDHAALVDAFADLRAVTVPPDAQTERFYTFPCSRNPTWCQYPDDHKGDCATATSQPMAAHADHCPCPSCRPSPPPEAAVTVPPIEEKP